MSRTRALPDPVPSPRAGRVSTPAYGFTLIELMIVVAIVGILAAIAYPSYGTYVQKTRRTDAQLSLLEQRQAMERCRSTSYSYASSSCTVDASSREGHYDLTVTKTATTFKITATAKSDGAQAGDTDCKKLTIDYLDQPGGETSAGASNDDCWN